MWTRYRRWKHTLVFPLVILALVLMKGEPEESVGWFAGMSIGVVLAIAYLTEEVVWIVQNRGRPCAACGQKIALRPFTLRVRCPHCGSVE